MEEKNEETQDWDPILKRYLEFEEYGERKRDSFEKAFASLIVAAFAFSIQFSSSLGKKAVILLVISWCLYFIASIAAWIRVYLNMRDSEAKAKLYFEISIAKELNENKMKEIYNKLSERDKFIKKVTFLFYIQSICFLFALFFNFLFATINVLPVSRCDHVGFIL